MCQLKPGKTCKFYSEEFICLLCICFLEIVLEMGSNEVMEKSGRNAPSEYFVAYYTCTVCGFSPVKIPAHVHGRLLQDKLRDWGCC